MLFDDALHGRTIHEIEIQYADVLFDVRDSAESLARIGPHRAQHPVALLQKQLGEI